MASYGFKIMKGYHPGDLHVHVYYNSKGPYGKPLGKYRIPSIEPLPGTKQKLNESEIEALRNWLNQDEQMKKLNDCLKSTVFSSHEIGKSAMKRVKQGDVLKDGGETFIVIKIPVIDRME
jgi:hypothetical protein